MSEFFGYMINEVHIFWTLFFIAFMMLLFFIRFLVSDFRRSDKPGKKKKEKPIKQKTVKAVAAKRLSTKTIPVKAAPPQDSPQIAARLESLDIRNPLTFISPKAWKYTLYNLFHKDKVILVHMELRNGNWRTFFVKPDGDQFRYRDNMYILDPAPDMKGYNIDIKQFQYWYHEDFALPFRFRFPVSQIKKKFEQSESKEVALSVHPAVLKRLIDSDIAQGVVGGAEIQAFFKRVIVILFVVLIICAAVLVINMWSSGLLEQLGKTAQGVAGG